MYNMYLSFCCTIIVLKRTSSLRKVKKKRLKVSVQFKLVIFSKTSLCCLFYYTNKYNCVYKIE